MRARIKSPPQETPTATLKGNCCSFGCHVDDDDDDDHDDGYHENDRRRKEKEEFCIDIIFTSLKTVAIPFIQTQNKHRSQRQLVKPWT